MDDPEFAECMKEVLKDDDQAKEAMKGLATMMNMIGQTLGTNSDVESPEEAEQALKRMMEQLQMAEEPEIPDEEAKQTICLLVQYNLGNFFNDHSIHPKQFLEIFGKEAALNCKKSEE